MPSWSSDVLIYLKEISSRCFANLQSQKIKEVKMPGKEIVSKKFRTLKGKEFQVTYCRITGRGAGPALTFIAGQHGMEHSGPNILTQVMEEISPDSFNGTLYLCPCANPLALEADYEIYPESEDLSKLGNYYYSISRHNYCVFRLGREDGVRTMYNMNRLWNREEKTGVAGEITAWLWNEICMNANVIVDFHSLQADKPLIYNAYPHANDIAKYFGVEAIHMCWAEPDEYNAHNLLYQANSGGRYGFCVEFSIQHGLKEAEYPIGVKGVYNLMKAMNMMNGEIIHSRPVWILPYGGEISLKSRHSGHIRYFFDSYNQVKTGDKLYEIRDIQTLELLEEGFSPQDGVFGAKSFKPVVSPGQIVCQTFSAILAAPAGAPLEKLAKDFFEDNKYVLTRKDVRRKKVTAEVELAAN